MKARFLKPGAVVNVDGRIMCFVMRAKVPGMRTQNVFHCADYVGLDGAGDDGLTTMTDHYFRTHAKPATVAESRAARTAAVKSISKAEGKQ